MAENAKTSGLKSAFDLAMERMARQGEGLATLSEEQKKELAEIGTRTKAKIAEVEIMYDKKLAELRAGSDAEALAKVEEEKRTAIARLRDREADERRKIRR